MQAVIFLEATTLVQGRAQRLVTFTPGLGQQQAEAGAGADSGSTHCSGDGDDDDDDDDDDGDAATASEIVPIQGLCCARTDYLEAANRCQVSASLYTSPPEASGLSGLMLFAQQSENLSTLAGATHDEVSSASSSASCSLWDPRWELSSPSSMCMYVLVSLTAVVISSKQLLVGTQWAGTCLAAAIAPLSMEHGAWLPYRLPSLKFRGQGRTIEHASGTQSWLNLCFRTSHLFSTAGLMIAAATAATAARPSLFVAFFAPFLPIFYTHSATRPDAAARPESLSGATTVQQSLWPLPL
ncbi:hypothetical protein M441DRAFT_50998 [Trichoderma asperellum CBS 433.97]|uniref:Uncharacterized protein n=1 Tax=Trichoderma asperellum (strain ATCC 204424 / CBS 433.97 / NBRC 101777) TaxID=1042311 RepID=A0A2T3YWQ8_TRIA4|nr:hypothetical protein M441DRAFT_50998 [Trichoderma asperellum CBS 433.97]PTB36995.1 hypothetical protein M441DRAFT_50998 [Trichoderma asperellum CBS 433.97]